MKKSNQHCSRIVIIQKKIDEFMASSDKELVIKLYPKEAKKLKKNNPEIKIYQMKTFPVADSLYYYVVQRKK